MSTPASAKRGWFTGLIDGAARAFAFGGSPATQLESRPQRTGRKIDAKGLTLQVQQLIASGHTPADIARRTALSQDTIALLLHLTPARPDETAAQGTIFRAAPKSAGGAG